MNKLLTKTRTFETFFDVKLNSKTPGTRKQYHYALKDFDDHVKQKYNLNLDQIIEEFKASEVEQIIDTLQGWINKSNIEIKNRQARVCQLNNYLYYRGVKIDPRDMKDLEYLNKESQERRAISLDEIQQILSRCSSQRKALYLAMLSSGMALEEACSIIKSDLDFSLERVRIVIKPEYTKKKSRGRTTFISKEAYKALKPFLKSKGPDDFAFHNSDDPKITKENESQCLRRVVDLLGLGQRYDSGTREITSHGFRAYFFTKAVQVHGENYAHKMTGHKGHLMEYDRYDDKVKLEMYLKLEDKLLIFEQPVDAKELESLKEQNQVILKQLNKMEMEQDKLMVTYMPEKEARDLFGNEEYNEIEAELDREYDAQREKELKELEKWVTPKIKNLIPNLEK